jgi:hypothetical protein
MPDLRLLKPGSIRAAVDITTFNDKDLTVDVIAATDTPVLRNGWDGPFYEILDMTRVRSERINAGAPALDNHNRYGSIEDNVKGVVVPGSVTFKDGQMRATIRLSSKQSQKEFNQDVKDGIYRNISIGYNVYELTETIKVGAIDTYRATDWEPTEISFVPIPGDFNAGVRSDDSSPSQQVSIIQNTNSNSTTMTEAEKAALAAARKRSSAIFRACTAAGLTPEYAEELDSSERSLEDALGQIALKKPAIPAPVPAPAPAAEGTRALEIISAVRTAGLDVEFAETLIKDPSVDIASARLRVIQEMAKSQPPAQRSANAAAAVTDDEAVHIRSAVEYALGARGNAEAYPLAKKGDKASEMAVAYRGISLLDTAVLLMKQRGIDPGYSKVEIVGRSLATGDFPNLLSNLAGKFLRREYELAPQTWREFCRQQDLPDFKPATGVQFGAASEFDKIEENGEYKYGSFSETVDNWKLSSYGKMFKLSRVMIINDDLGGFTRTASLIAARAANNEANIVWALLTGGTGGNGATMADTVQLFDAAHNNLAGAGAVLSVTTLSAARTAMNRQKGMNAKEIIKVTPRYILVPPEQQTLAEQLVTSITPNQVGSVNPFYNKLGVIMDPRMTNATAWMLVADTSMMDGITYGYLQGQPGLRTETRYGFNVDGVEIKAATDFAAKAWDHRPFYKNPGA